ncbi:MAG: GtrA family protein [Acetobacteraceae bacterium]|nr:GtrA family protein [Acetobacteraceae bacterium]
MAEPAALPLRGLVARASGSRMMRFLLVGGINTGVTFLLFLALARLMPAPAAYTVTYVLGIALSYALNSLFVFRTEMSVGTALRFPFVYVAQYLYGLAVVWLLTAWLHLPNEPAILVVIVTSIPLTFVLSRVALRAA